MEFKRVQTQLITVDRNDPDIGSLQPVARAARDGDLIVFPTDTVYGIGTNGLISGAALDIFDAKRRPPDKPLILLISEPADVNRYIAKMNDIAARLMRLYWPGPLTLIFKKSDLVPAEVTAGGDTVGIRCPDDRIAREIIRMAGVALATTSANIAGKPSPISAEEALEGLQSRVSYVVDGGKTCLGIESTVVDVSWGEPAVLREGTLRWNEIVASLEA